jgi:hypothetical protein
VSVNWGDTVVFSNGDSQPHVVASDRGAFTSPSIPPSGTYAHSYQGDPGTYNYLQQGGAQDHVGQVVVDLRGDVKLSTSSRDTLSYRALLRLTGRSSFVGYPVKLSFRAAGRNSAWRDVQTVQVDSAGAFSARIKPPGGGCYRAAAADGRVTSAEICLKVRPRVRMAVPARKTRAGRTLVVIARIEPANAAAQAELERFDFGRKEWTTVLSRPVSHGKAIFRWKAIPGAALLRVEASAGDIREGFDAAMSPFVRITVVPARSSG